MLVLGVLLALASGAWALDGSGLAANQAARPIEGLKDAPSKTSFDNPPPVICQAPGDTVGQTTYDWWCNGPGKRMIVVNPPDGGIHLVWIHSDLPNPFTDRHMRYNCYQPGTGWIFGTGMAAGVDVQTTYRSGYGTIDIHSSEIPYVSLHRTLPTDYLSCVAYDVAPYTGAFLTVNCSTAFPDSIIWPRVAIDSDDNIHVISKSYMARQKLWHCRSTDDGQNYTQWVELDTMRYGWHNVAASKQTPTVAAIYAVVGDSTWIPADRNNSLVVYESYDGGASFTRRTLLRDLLAPGDTLDCFHWGGNALYDVDDSVHVVSVATRPADPGYYYPMAACNLWHYTPEHGLSLVTSYPWMYQSPAFDGLNGIYGNNQLVHMPSLGEDPGTGHLFVLWNEFPWYEEQGLFECGELFASRSTDGGQTWSFKHDLTNTHNESEVYPALAELVDGTLHVIYESDLVAGAYVQGDAPISFNPVRYMEHEVVDADVAVVSIDSIPSDASYNQSYTPHVTVQNNGTETISFSVSCQADYEGYAFYMDTQPVYDLAGGSSTTVSFMPWTPDTVLQGYTGWFWACAGHVGDTDYSNDCQQLQVVVGVAEGPVKRSVAQAFVLGPVHPNPFSVSASVRYEIASAGDVTLGVYDASGRIVRTLVDENLPAGAYTVTWNGRDSEGRLVPNGVYFYRLISGGRVSAAKTVLMR
jgi:hypothetical protein